MESWKGPWAGERGGSGKMRMERKGWMPMVNWPPKSRRCLDLSYVQEPGSNPGSWSNRGRRPVLMSVATVIAGGCEDAFGLGHYMGPHLCPRTMLAQEPCQPG